MLSFRKVFPYSGSKNLVQKQVNKSSFNDLLRNVWSYGHKIISPVRLPE